MRDSFRRNLLSMALRTAATCLTPSRELQVLLEKWSVHSVQFVPNGVELEPIISTHKDVDVVTVCRLVPWKHVANLIEACSRLGASLHIVGDGPLMNDLKQRSVSLGSTSLTTFHGSLESEEVKRVLDRSRVFALVSSYEGMSFSLLEAMSRQMPVVAGLNAGNRSVISHGQNGLLVDCENIEEISESIRQVLTDESLAISLGTQARRTVENRFSIDLTLSRTIHLIESAAS
jgi:glycosyltransferase involved in cell wall biosynthesis